MKSGIRIPDEIRNEIYGEYLHGTSISKIAKKHGLHPNTIFNWKTTERWPDPHTVAQGMMHAYLRLVRSFRQYVNDQGKILLKIGETLFEEKGDSFVLRMLAKLPELEEPKNEASKCSTLAGVLNSPVEHVETPIHEETAVRAEEPKPLEESNRQPESKEPAENGNSSEPKPFSWSF